MRIGVFGITCVTLTLTGCATLFGASPVGWPWEDKPPCKTDICNAAESLNAFVAASNYCRAIQGYYESGGRKSNNAQLTVGIVGMVAGAVVAPVAQGSAAKAWSGLSGATNGLQLALEDTFSTSLSVKRRVAVVDAAASGVTAYMKENSDYTKKVVLSVDMALQCSMAAAKADQAALLSISSK